MFRKEDYAKFDVLNVHLNIRNMMIMTKSMLIAFFKVGRLLHLTISYVRKNAPYANQKVLMKMLTEERNK